MDKDIITVLILAIIGLILIFGGVWGYAGLAPACITLGGILLMMVLFWVINN